MGYQETDGERIEERIRPIKERMTITAVHRNGKMWVLIVGLARLTENPQRKCGRQLCDQIMLD